jgi:hypothetical protein
VDRYAPAVSASNASDTWFASQTATVSASDVTGGAGANSGVLQVRYAWNAALDAACTTGTVTSSGATLTVPVGDNLLYLCAKDNVSRVTQWNGRYRVAAPPSVTGTVSPTQGSYLNTFTWTATATGGVPGTIQYAFFRRPPGGTWIPSVTAPNWQASNVYAWHPTVADAGTWETYIWVKDGNTPANMNTYGYAAGYNTGPITVIGPPTVPGPTTVACAYAVADDCWVTGDFTASVTASTGGVGTLVYQICRSNDSAGWGGCEVNLTLSGGTSLLISGTNLASDGFRRAYYFQAKDTAGALSGWNTPRYVRVDRYPPVASATNASSLWFSSRTATLSASDTGSGLAAVRYSWNTALDAGCTTGTATASGTVLTAPAGDNVLYLCARDNTGRVGQWSGQYRIAPITLTATVSPARGSYLGTFTWTATAGGGTPATTRFAFFRRLSGGAWIPDVNAPNWQAGNVFNWTPTLSDVGTWETYVWVKDGDTPANANTYGYAAGFNTGPIEVVGRPTVPGPTTVGCAYAVADDCWVTGDFTASVTASTGGMGSLVYQICRSNDSPGGVAGCEVNLTLAGGTSLLISGVDLPGSGSRRAYYFQAKDSAGALSGWNAPRYVRVDRTAPDVSATNASDQWFTSSTATVSASDSAGGAGANSGLAVVRYSWNSALDAGCTTGTATTAGATLTAPAGDNVLYLCARDNVGRVTQWDDRFRVSNILTLTGSVSPSRGSYLGTFTWTASSTGGSATTTRYAFFRRPSGGTWIPDVTTPNWQASNVFTWTPTLADVGTWETYIWVRDDTTPAGANTYGYAAGFNPGPIEVVGPPTAPGPTTVGCAYTVAASGDCWVTGDFTASVAASTGGMGSLVYQICRSNDSPGGFAGCEANLTLTGGTSILVSGVDLPADGYRRVYYFQAKDAAGALSGWNSPAFVRVDRHAPVVLASNASDEWFTSRAATVSASDDAGGTGANSGLVEARYSWNAALDAACATGTVVTAGTTLAVAAGDNVLYLCARDNTGWVAQWSGRYRVAGPTTLISTPSPAQAPYGSPITWTATATGGVPETRQYALFHRRSGGTWIPPLNAPAWQPSNILTWTPTADDLGPWEIYIWEKDSLTPADANGYGYAAGTNPGPVEVVVPSGFALDVTPAATAVMQGGQALFTISLDPEPGFTGTAVLSVAGIPPAASQTVEPVAIGAGDSAIFRVNTTRDTPLGDHVLTVTATAGSVTRTATAQLTVTSAHKPLLEGISPDSFGNGGRVRVTVEGSFLSGATVSVAREQTDPDDPVSRVFPTAQVISINSSGTSMVVEIDATDTRILDFHNLVVDNGVDIAAIQFRVLPGGPLVDAWTPSQPQVDRIHALSIAGRNLSGTTLTPSVAGRIRLHSVETTDTEITALLEVLPNAPTGPMSLIVSDAAGRTVEVPITIVLPQKSTLASHNLTERRDGEKVDGGYSRLPAIWFQEFVVRDPYHTEVLAKGKGLRIQALDRERIAERSGKTVSFDFYIHVTIPLVRVQWQKVILFDPITGELGDALLQALGLGARAHIGAFVLSAYFQMDLTIYFRLTNFGFSFPLYCIEIAYGIEVTGFDGFVHLQSFCRGGGSTLVGKGSLANGEITGGDCASVTPTRFENGVIEGDVQQNACCSQPIGVTVSGNTFTGLPWGKSFSINNPQAGTTTPDPAACTCPCIANLQGTALTPGNFTKGNLEVTNLSNETCTYQYDITQISGQTQMDLANSRGTLTVSANTKVSQPFIVSFPQGRPAPDVATLDLAILRPGSDGNLQVACESTKISCVFPSGETSSFVDWWDREPSDTALFLARLTPSETDFAGRAVTEDIPSTHPFDNCYKAGSPFPNYAQDNLTGGVWNIVPGNKYHEGDLIGMKCTPQPNQQCDLDQYYQSVGQTPCTLGTTQVMKMSCGPMQVNTGVIPYAANKILFNVTAEGTKIQRGNAVSPLH